MSVGSGSSPIKLDTTAAGTVPARVAHYLPCTVHFDGAAPTARAFCPFPAPMTSFRGRALKAGNMHIPDGYQMVVLEKGNKDGQQVARVKYPLEADGFFYQHDEQPDEDSPVNRALEWLKLAAVLHEPLEMEDDETEKKDEATS